MYPGQFVIYDNHDLTFLKGHHRKDIGNPIGIRPVFLYRVYFRVIFVFDVTNKNSFVNTASWFKDVQQNLDRDWKGIILANKIDLRDNRVIGPRAGQVIADKTGLDYLETSARTGVNIDNLFQILSKKILATKI